MNVALVKASRPKSSRRVATLFAALAASGVAAGCSLPAAQSPQAPAGMAPGMIALETFGSTDGATPEIRFDYHPAEIDVRGTARDMSVAYPSGSFLTVGDQRYELAEIHFHARSVHTIDGVSYPLEAHLVHLDRYRRPAVVIAVLLREGANSPALEKMLAMVHAPMEAPMTPGSASPPFAMQGRTRAMFDPRDLLPQDHSYLAYRGPLPIAPQMGDATWLVMKQPVEASMEQLATCAPPPAGMRRPAVVVHRSTGGDDGYDARRLGYDDEGARP